MGKVVPSDTIEGINTKGLVFKVISTKKSPTEDLITNSMPEF